MARKAKDMGWPFTLGAWGRKQLEKKRRKPNSKRWQPPAKPKATSFDVERRYLEGFHECALQHDRWYMTLPQRYQDSGRTVNAQLIAYGEVAGRHTQ